jgi:drug/metabolite transporter (DMT)-like permease
MAMRGRLRDWVLCRRRIAYSRFFLLRVLTRLEATQAGFSIYLIPFFGVLIAALVLHERLTPNMVFGGLLVLVATAVVTFGGSGAQSKSIYPA